MRPARQADPFALLGLPARPGLTDDEVRGAWRRIAAATHPDRADGGDAARFAAAAAAYTMLRTNFGRAEALADLARPAGLGRVWPARAGRVWPARAGRGASAGHPGRRWPGSRWRPAAAGEKRRRRPAAGLAAGRWWSRVRRGRPARLALRIAAVAAVSAGVALVAGTRPATPALITGAVTWLALTARHDLAPPG
jgi:curved DNA-binding protein CbpA